MPQTPDSPKQRYIKPLIITLSIAVIIAAAATVAAMFISSSSRAHKSESLAKSMQTFTEMNQGFSVNFPTEPVMSDDWLDIDGSQIPYTQYTSETRGGSVVYLVQITDYSNTFNLEGMERDVLKGATEGMAETDNIELVSSENNTTLKGLPAATATYTVKTFGSKSTMYALNLVKDNRLYTLTTTGVDESDFRKFVASFKFLPTDL